MIIHHPSQRIGIFIDVQNMYHTAKALYEQNVNFAKIVELATQDRQLVRAIGYVIKSEAPKEQQFFDALEKIGIELAMKDVQVFASGQKKGDWDVGMAVDAIKIAHRLDVVVLVTGDGDFCPLVNYLRENKGCKVEGVGFARSTSAKLIESLDHFTYLDKNPRPYLMR